MLVLLKFWLWNWDSFILSIFSILQHFLWLNDLLSIPYLSFNLFVTKIFIMGVFISFTTIFIIAFSIVFLIASIVIVSLLVQLSYSKFMSITLLFFNFGHPLSFPQFIFIISFIILFTSKDILLNFLIRIYLFPNVICLFRSCVFFFVRLIIRHVFIQSAFFYQISFSFFIFIRCSVTNMFKSRPIFFD